jgi:hypothetical protein
MADLKAASSILAKVSMLDEPYKDVKKEILPFPLREEADGGYSFLVGLFHSLLHAGLSRRTALAN